MLWRRRVWCVAGLVLATAVLIAAVPVPEEDALASLLDGDEQTAGEWVLSEEGQRGQLMDHERAEAVDEMSLLQFGLSAMPRVTQTAWFDMSIGGEAAGRIRLGLFGEVTPATVANFVGLVRGGSERNGRPLHYKGSRMHRIMPGFMLQGGDFTRGDGAGGDEPWP